MTIAMATVSMAVALNAAGLAVSLWLDRRGIPAGASAQAVDRKPNSLSKRLPLILANLAVLIGGTAVGLSFLDSWFTFDLPSPIEAIAHICFLVVLDDVWFYWVHRALHENKWLYKKIHKVHHRAFAPVPIEYIYVHPAEWMAGAIGPAAAILAITLMQGQMNAWTFLFWSGMRTLHELDIHSGVRSWLSNRLPVVAPTEHHDMHHAKPTLGNYASTFTIWDRLFKTQIQNA